MIQAKKIAKKFQSTLPVGGATFGHPPLLAADGYFNPRSPWGERLTRFANSLRPSIFQSTLPVGGATSRFSYSFSWLEFQSTLPAGGATFLPRLKFVRYVFQSTLPAGGATNEETL